MAETFGSPEKLGRIHDRRLEHAIASCVEELVALKDKRVNRILERFNIQVFKSVAADYPPGAKQILEKELRAAKGLEAK